MGNPHRFADATTLTYGFIGTNSASENRSVGGSTPLPDTIRLDVLLLKLHRCFQRREELVAPLSWTLSFAVPGIDPVRFVRACKVISGRQGN
jgi:hypothetical protein